MALPSKDIVPYSGIRFSMINKVATTHYSFLRRQIKREDISTNAVSVTKTELYTILRDVCIVSNRLTCIDAKLSEMEILAQPLSFYSGNLSNVARLAAHPKFVWVFNANCDGTIIYNDPVQLVMKVILFFCILCKSLLTKGHYCLCSQ
jgi:hypothetical protein